MTFREFLIEAKISDDPDKFYTKPGSIAFIYSAPYLYWADPKEKVFKKNNKEDRIATINLLRKGFWPDQLFSSGEMTHYHMELSFRKNFDDDFDIRGRVSPNKKEIAIWDLGPWAIENLSPTDQRRYERTKNKAIDAIYKYIL